MARAGLAKSPRRRHWGQHCTERPMIGAGLRHGHFLQAQSVATARYPLTTGFKPAQWHMTDEGVCTSRLSSAPSSRKHTRSLVLSSIFYLPSLSTCSHPSREGSYVFFFIESKYARLFVIFHSCHSFLLAGPCTTRIWLFKKNYLFTYLWII